MTDLLSRLSASGQKIGVTCRLVRESWHMGMDGKTLALAYDDGDEISNAPATMLLLKALEAKEVELVKWHAENMHQAWPPTPEWDVNGAALNLFRQALDLKRWRSFNFEAVLTAAVSVCEGLE